MPVRVRVRHPLLAHDRLELAELDHAARRLEVVEDRLEAREALEAHHLFGEERAVVAVHDVTLSAAGRRGAGRTAWMEDIAGQIEREVASWEGVTAHPHRFGGVEFRLGRRELGHLHGERWADLPFQQADPRHARRDRPRAAAPRAARNGLGVAADPRRRGRAEVIELFRLGYERARVARAGQSPAKRSAPTFPPGDDDADRRRVDEPFAQRGDPDGAARLDDELQPLEREPHRLDDLRVGDGDDLVDEPRGDLPGQLPGRVRLQPVGDRARHVDRRPARPRRTNAASRRPPPARRRRRASRRGPWRSSRSRRSARRRRRARPACRRRRRPRSARARRCPARP